MSDIAETIGKVLGATLAALTLLGLAIRFVLVPYLREHLIAPLQRTEDAVQRTEHAVRANGHKDPENPTMRDQFSDVLQEIRGLRGDVAQVKADVADVKDDVADVKGDLTKHLNWSSEETSRLWSAIKRAR